MPKVLVLYYSSYGHIEQMAEAVAAGARETRAMVDVKRVPETAPEDVARAGHFKPEQAAPVAPVTDLENYDAIIIGTPTRYGRMASQMANFLDQTGGLWLRGALNGKVGAAVASTASQHGGQETTLFRRPRRGGPVGLCCILFFGLFGVFDWDRLTARTGTIGHTASS